MMSKIEKVRNNWRNRSFWTNNVPSYVRNKMLTVNSLYHDRRIGEGIDVMKEDWDNLIILDGCRYDLFREANSLDGKLTRVVSQASHTPNFLKQNFGGRELYDTVYITANPVYTSPKFDIDIATSFFNIYEVWKTDWDSNLQTVHPEAMAKKTSEFHHSHPEKRLISHFVQPHYPFIGEKGRKVKQSAASTIPSGNEDLRSGDRQKIWIQLKNGDVSYEWTWKAYRENLELALSNVKTLLKQLSGKTVVTSDHGNQLGEHTAPFPIKIYGHPGGFRTPELAYVPWFVVDGERRNVTKANSPLSRASLDAETGQQLKNLGYK